MTRIVVAACGCAAFVLAVAFEAVAVSLFRSADTATGLVPCALGLLMICVTAEIGWGSRRTSDAETAPSHGGEAPAVAVD